MHEARTLSCVNGPAAGERGEGPNFQLSLPQRAQLEVGAGTSQIRYPLPPKGAKSGSRGKQAELPLFRWSSALNAGFVQEMMIMVNYLLYS